MDALIFPLALVMLWFVLDCAKMNRRVRFIRRITEAEQQRVITMPRRAPRYAAIFGPAKNDQAA